MSGWTNVRVEVEDGTVDEATADPQTNEERVEEYFEENGFSQIGELTFQAPDRHWGFSATYGSSDPYQAMEIFEDLPMVTRAVVMYANDTSDSGTAYMYERDGDSAEQVDMYEGAGSARGHDTREYMSDEHGLTVSPQSYW